MRVPEYHSGHDCVSLLLRRLCGVIGLKKGLILAEPSMEVVGEANMLGLGNIPADKCEEKQG